MMKLATLPADQRADYDRLRRRLETGAAAVLRQYAAQLDALARLFAVEGDPDAVSPIQTAVAALPAGSVAGDKVPPAAKRIVGWLHEATGVRRFTVDDAHAALGPAYSRNAVKKACDRLATKGALVRHADGSYERGAELATRDLPLGDGRAGASAATVG